MLFLLRVRQSCIFMKRHPYYDSPDAEVLQLDFLTMFCDSFTGGNEQYEEEDYVWNS